MSSIYSLFFTNTTTSASPHLVKIFPVLTASFILSSPNVLPNIFFIAAIMYSRISGYSSRSQGAPRKNSFPGESFPFSTKRTCLPLYENEILPMLDESSARILASGHFVLVKSVIRKLHMESIFPILLIVLPPGFSISPRSPSWEKGN